MKSPSSLRARGLHDGLAALLVTLLVLPPLLGILWSAVSGEGLQTPWPDGRQRVILCRSLFLSACSAAGACAIGAGLALVLHVQGPRVQRLWRGLLLGLAALPPYLYALAWSEMLGTRGFLAFLTPIVGHPMGFAWCVFLLILAYFPLAALLIGAGLNGLDSECLQAGWLAAAPGRYLKTILFPLVRPYLLASVALVFLLVFVDYSVPSQLSVNTYPVEVFIAYSATLVPAGALRGLLPLLLLGPCILLLHFGILRGRPNYQFRRPAPIMESHSDLLVPSAVVLGAVLLGLPLLQLAKSGWPPTDIWGTLAAARTAIGHSLLYASAGGILAMGLAALLLPPPFSPPQARRLAAWVRVLAILPVGMPGTAVGLGLIAATQGMGLSGAARSPFVLMIGYAVIVLPFAWVVLDAFVRPIPPELFDAGALSDRPVRHKWTRLVLPLWAPGFVCGFTVASILILRELGVAVMLAAPGIENLALRIDSFIHYGAGGAVASLALFQALLTLALCAGAAGFLRVLGRAGT